MLPLILIPLLLCLFNIYRRLTCIIKVKFTKFTLMTLIIALALMLFAGYKLKNDLVGYIIVLSWWRKRPYASRSYDERPERWRPR